MADLFRHDKLLGFWGFLEGAWPNGPGPYWALPNGPGLLGQAHLARWLKPSVRHLSSRFASSSSSLLPRSLFSWLNARGCKMPYSARFAMSIAGTWEKGKETVPDGPRPMVLSQRTWPIGPGPMGQAHWAGPLGLVHWAWPIGLGPLGLVHWAWPTGPSPLGLAFGPGPFGLTHWTWPIGPGPLGQAHWARPNGPGTLGLAQWARHIGPGPMGLAHWAWPDGPSPLLGPFRLAHWASPKGPGPMGLAQWAWPNGPGPFSPGPSRPKTQSASFGLLG